MISTINLLDRSRKPLFHPTTPKETIRNFTPSVGSVNVSIDKNRLDSYQALSIRLWNILLGSGLLDDTSRIQRDRSVYREIAESRGIQAGIQMSGSAGPEGGLWFRISVEVSLDTPSPGRVLEYSSASAECLNLFIRSRRFAWIKAAAGECIPRRVFRLGSPSNLAERH